MPVILTEKAANEVKRHQEENKVEGECFLRVGVVASGCQGYEYKLEFDQEFNAEQDEQFDYHGIKLIVDKKSALVLDGTTIDWHDSLDRTGFRFDNPNVTKSCGCGSSFQV